MGYERAEVEAWCLTKAKDFRFRFLWRIHSFQQFLNMVPGHVLKSASFVAGPTGEVKWRMHLYPNGVNYQMTQQIGIFLSLVSSEDPEIATALRFALINIDGDEVGGKWSCAWHPFSHLSVNQCTWGQANFITIEDLMRERYQLLPKGTITILCEGRVRGPTLTTHGPGSLPPPPLGRPDYLSGFMPPGSDDGMSKFSSPQEAMGERPGKQSSLLDMTQDESEEQLANAMVNVPASRLKADLGRLLSTAHYADLIVIVKGKKMRVHRAILAVRCPRMLAESERDYIALDDYTPEVIAQFLRYIYTDQVSHLSTMDVQLLGMSHKFEIPRLKALCEASMSAGLTLSNVAQCAVLAHSYEADQLMESAITLMRQNKEQVLADEDMMEAIKQVCPFVIDVVKMDEVKTDEAPA